MVHLSDVSEQHGRDRTIPFHPNGKLVDEVRVTQMGQRIVTHCSTYTGAMDRRKQGAAFAWGAASVHGAGFAKPRRQRATGGQGAGWPHHDKAAAHYSKPVCSVTRGSGMPSNVRISFAPVAAWPAWQLLKNTNVFWVLAFKSRIFSAHSLSSASV